MITFSAVGEVAADCAAQAGEWKSNPQPTMQVRIATSFDRFAIFL